MSTSPDRYVLAIDMGSGSAKVAVVSSAGAVVASGLGAIRTIFSEDGGVEQDPEEYWSAVRLAAPRAIYRRLNAEASDQPGARKI